MKLCRKQDASIKNYNHECQITEYPMYAADVNTALVHLNGRYPESGYVVNKKCSELAFIQEGNGNIIINGETIHLTSGDVILIEKDEPYYWHGNMRFLVACTPAWFAAQHQFIS